MLLFSIPGSTCLEFAAIGDLPAHLCHLLSLNQKHRSSSVSFYVIIYLPLCIYWAVLLACVQREWWTAEIPKIVWCIISVCVFRIVWLLLHVYAVVVHSTDFDQFFYVHMIMYSWVFGIVWMLCVHKILVHCITFDKCFTVHMIMYSILSLSFFH